MVLLITLHVPHPQGTHQNHSQKPRGTETRPGPDAGDHDPVRTDTDSGAAAASPSPGVGEVGQ